MYSAQAERGERTGPIGTYELLLPKNYPRLRRLQGSIAEKLGLFALAKREELRAALNRRLELTEELLEAMAHNLRRSEILHRRVLADRKRLLGLLELLEDENRRFHHQLSRKGRGDGPA